MLSQLVGEKGYVTGIDMTEDQVMYLCNHSTAAVHCELKSKIQTCVLFLARRGQDIRRLSHERFWLQEAQCQFCPGLH